MIDILTHINEGEKIKPEKIEEFVEKLNPNHIPDPVLIERTDKYFESLENPNLYSVWTKMAFKVIFNLNIMSPKSFAVFNEFRDKLKPNQKEELLDCWLPHYHHVLMTPF